MREIDAIIVLTKVIQVYSAQRKSYDWATHNHTPLTTHYEGKRKTLINKTNKTKQENLVIHFHGNPFCIIGEVNVALSHQV